MSRNYSVTEPHPSVPKSGTFVVGGGIGGAGNYRKYQASEVTSGPNASGPASRAPLARPTVQRHVTVGRGGAGNLYSNASPQSEEAMFQFDEEITKRREAQAPVYHIGRGGAGNFTSAKKPKTERQGSSGSESGSIASSNSNGSVRSAVGRLTRKLSGRP